MAHLDEAIALIETNFPAKWWESYGFDKEKKDFPDLENKLSEFKELISKLGALLFDHFNLSIITGEYVSDINTKEKLAKLKMLILEARPQLIAPEEEVQDVLAISNFTSGFITPITLAIDIYFEFVVIINRKLNISDNEYIARYHDEIISAFEDQDYDINSKNSLQLFQINILVASVDHFLSVDGNQLDNLVIWSVKLGKKLNIKPYSPLIKKKCDYLKDKLLLRRRHENKSKPVFMFLNAQERQVSITDFKDGVFDGFLEYIDSHYEMGDNWRNTISANCQSQLTKKLEICSSLELHSLIKYHKDIERSYPSSIETLKKIRKEYQRRLELAMNNGGFYDIYAYRVALNYSINNEFSLCCDDPSADISKVELLYNEIMSVQKDTRIKNFFPQLKFLSFLLRQLKKDFHDRKALEFVQPCRNIINKCQEIYSQYKINVDWSKGNYNYVFQLPFSECCLDIKDSNANKIFIFSSFLMPLPKGKYIKEFEENKGEVSQLESAINVFENISKDINELQELKSTATEREIKTMEILGVFAAILSFIAASLPTFKVIETPLQAALFMLALGTSLCGFVLILLSSFRGGKRIKENFLLVIFFIAATTVFWGLLIAYSINKPIHSFIDPKVIQEQSHTPINSNNTIYLPTNSNKQSSEPSGEKKGENATVRANNGKAVVARPDTTLNAK